VKRWFKKLDKETLRTGIVFLLVGVGIGLLFSADFKNEEKEVRKYADNDFHFVNPLLECDLGPQYIAQGKPRPSQKLIEVAINKLKNSGAISDAAVYYRDLNNGPWVGVNSTMQFIPASLLKVPLAMRVYKEVERNPALLQGLVKVPKLSEAEFKIHYQPAVKIQEGEVYNLQQMLEHMLVYSDNGAVDSLMPLLPHNALDEMFKELHLSLPKQNEVEFISVRDYSSFFRVLFNASYISQQYSEEMLELLSHTTFKDGIVKYLPEDIVVAHKFGEAVVQDVSGTLTNQIHNCGIVYYPGHPYALCIMTRGTDAAKLAEAVASISKVIYEEVDSQVK
jgi:beta-lactamase class A